MRTASTLTLLLTTICAVAAHYYLWLLKAPRIKLEVSESRDGVTEPASYRSIRIASYDPFIAYIPDFVSLSERQYLVNLAKPLLRRSTVSNHTLSHRRTSSTAFLPSNDTIVKTLAKRAADFQGFFEVKDVDIQVTSYTEGQEYRPHHDWYHASNGTIQRFSTFFAILDASCQDCGTWFPHVRVDWSKRDPRWCEIVDCNVERLITKNIPGSAFFWRNLDVNGTGMREVLHAGLPATNGTKVGLNIWTEIGLHRFKDGSI